MKKILKITAIIFLMSIVAGCTKDLLDLENIYDNQPVTDIHPKEIYYYYDSEAIPLYKTEGKYYVVYYTKNEGKIREALDKAGTELLNVDNQEEYRYCDGSGSGFKKFKNYSTAFIECDFEKIKGALSHTIYWTPYYYGEWGRVIPVETIIVVLKKGTTLSQVKNLAKKNSLEMLGWDKREDNCYILACTNRSKGNSVQMANLFYETGLFEWAQPDMISGSLTDIDE